jgi:PAS domain S-box-containing protein
MDGNKKNRLISKEPEWLNTIFRSIQDGISVLNSDLTIRFVNPIMKKWYSSNLPLIGKKCYRVYHNKDEPCDPCPTIKCLQTGRTEKEIIKGLEGTDVKYIELFSYPIKNETTGEITGVVEFVRNITKTIKAREALKDSKRMLSNLMANLPGMVYQCENLRDWQMNFVSEGSFKLTGYSPEELIDSKVISYQQVIHPVDRNRIWNEVQDALSKNDPFQLTYRIITAQGKEKWVQENGLGVYNQESDLIFLEGFVIDITERKKVEKERIKFSKLESLGILAGGIAHDFNNLLSGIFGNIELALLSMPPDSEAVRYLDTAGNVLEDATNLANQLLTFSKGGEPRRQSLEINEFIKDIAGFSIHGSSCRIGYELQKDLPLVEVDKSQLNQVFTNLLINAKETMKNQGIIIVRTDKIFRKGKTFIKIEIEDEGSGISEENIDYIFDPYFTTKKQGNGLGLATSHSIISKHGGELFVESNLNEGTIFSVLLPVSPSTKFSQAITNESNTVTSCRGKKILFMDDVEVIRNVVRVMLQKMGCQVYCATDGEEVLRKYMSSLQENQKFDAVIMDLTVPGGIGGEQVSQKILEVDPEAVLIVSSGYVNNSILSNPHKYGFKDRLVKPYNFKKLQEVILSCLQ